MKVLRSTTCVRVYVSLLHIIVKLCGRMRVRVLLHRLIMQFLGMSHVYVRMVVLKMCTQTEQQISNADIYENYVELCA